MKARIHQTLSFSIKHPFTTVFVLVMITLLTGLGLGKLKIVSNIDDIISKRYDLTPYNQFTSQFNADHDIFVFIQDPKLFTPEKMPAFRAIDQALLAVPFVKTTRNLFTIQNFRSKNGVLETSVILDPSMDTQEAFDEAKADALYNDILNNLFINEAGDATLIQISLLPEFDNGANDVEIHETINNILKPYQGDFQHLFTIGKSIVNQEMNLLLFKDASSTALFAYALILLFLFIMTRSKASFIVVFLTATTSIIWTFGIMGWLNIPMNPLLSVLPTLLIVIGSTEDMHMFAAYVESLHEGHTPKTTRMGASTLMLRKVSLPVILTATTTILGFAFSSVSDMPMVRHFGIITAIAFLMNAAATLIIVPLFLSQFGPIKHAIPHHTIFQRLAKHIINMCDKYAVYFLIAFSVITVVLVSFLPRLNIDTSFYSMIKPSQKIVQQIDYLGDTLSGSSDIFVFIDTQKPGAFKSPTELKFLDEIRHEIQAMPGTRKIESLDFMLSYLNQEMNEGNPEFNRIPENDELVEQYLLFFQPDELERVSNYDFSQAVMIVRHNYKDTTEVEAYAHDIEKILKNILPPRYKASVLDKDVYLFKSGRDLIGSQLTAILYLVVAIVLIVGLLFSSFIAGFVALIPNVIPVLWIFGFLALFNMPLNIGTALVAVVVISIAVDDTIHLFYRYIKACQQHPNNKDAIHETLKSEVTPVITSSLALSISFLALLISPLRSVSNFGLLLAISVFLTMIADLLLTPLLLSKIRIMGIWNLMNPNLLESVVYKSPLFHGMSRIQIRRAILLCSLQEAFEGDVILQQGETSRHMYMILEGEALVEQANDVGRVTEIARLHPGDVFGEMAYVDNIQRTATVKATAPCKLMIFGEDQLTEHMRFYPFTRYRLALNMARILTLRLRETTLLASSQHSIT